MERGVRNFIIVFVAVLVLLMIGFASAESSGFWARITGKALAPGSTSCIDYDGKDNFLKSSFINLDEKFNFYDYCSGNIVYDYYCSVNAAQQRTFSVSAYAISSDYGFYGKTARDCIFYGPDFICQAGACVKNKTCSPGETRVCSGSSVGECFPGTETCGKDGEWSGICEGVIGPIPEICGDGLDNDCDGLTDEGGVCGPIINLNFTYMALSDNSPNIGQEISIKKAVENIGNLGFYIINYSNTDYLPTGEVAVDEGQVNSSPYLNYSETYTFYETKTFYETGVWILERCYTARSELSIDGVYGYSSDCLSITFPVTGNDTCVEGEAQTCGTNIGECIQGIRICTNGTLGVCVGGIFPTSEICDGLDNDCDAQIDEGGVCGNETNQTGTCFDSDGGIVYDVFGTVSGNYGDGTPFSFIDFCSGGNILTENFCSLSGPQETEHFCSVECTNGACNKNTTQEFHTICSNNQCVDIIGPGSNECSDDSNCALNNTVSCQLTGAFWDVTDSVFEGTKVQLIVQGIDCDGVSVSFTVFEDDVLGDDLVNINPPNTVFNGPVATTSWIAEYQDDGVFGGTPEYYFLALPDLGDDLRSSPPDLVVTENDGNIFHSVCNPSFACEVVPGPGNDVCSTDVDCGSENVSGGKVVEFGIISQIKLS